MGKYQVYTFNHLLLELEAKLLRRKFSDSQKKTFSHVQNPHSLPLLIHSGARNAVFVQVSLHEWNDDTNYYIYSLWIAKQVQIWIKWFFSIVSFFLRNFLINKMSHFSAKFHFCKSCGYIIFSSWIIYRLGYISFHTKYNCAWKKYLIDSHYKFIWIFKLILITKTKLQVIR